MHADMYCCSWRCNETNQQLIASCQQPLQHTFWRKKILFEDFKNYKGSLQINPLLFVMLEITHRKQYFFTIHNLVMDCLSQSYCQKTWQVLESCSLLVGKARRLFETINCIIAWDWRVVVSVDDQAEVCVYKRLTIINGHNRLELSVMKEYLVGVFYDNLWITIY